MRKGKELDPVIWSRAWIVINENHMAGLELDEKQILSRIHIRAKGKRESLCGVAVHPANSEWHRPEDVAGNKPHAMACPECAEAYQNMVYEEGKRQVREYWAKPNAGHALPEILEPPKVVRQVEYEQPSLF